VVPDVVPDVVPVPLTVADVVAGLPDGYREPVCMAAFVAGFRAMVGMADNGGRADRAAMVAAFVTAANAVQPADVPPMGKRHGRWSGLPVAESQNVLYVAAIVADVAVTESMIMAAWRAELPNAKCDFLNRNYAWSTLSQYVNGHHGIAPGIPGARDAVAAWRKRGSKPAAR